MAIPPVQRFDFSTFVEGKLCMSHKNLFACETPLLKEKNLCEFLINLDQEEYQIATQENKDLIEEKNAEQIVKQQLLLAEQETLVNKQKESENAQFYWRIAKYAMFGLGALAFVGSLFYVWKTRAEIAKWDAWSKAVIEYNKRPENHQIARDWLDRVPGGKERYEKYQAELKQKFGAHDGGITKARYEDRSRTFGGASVALGLAGGGCALVEQLVALPSSDIAEINEEFGPKDYQISKNRELRILDKIRRIELRMKAIHDETEQIQLGQAFDYFTRFKPLNPDNIVHHQHHHDHL